MTEQEGPLETAQRYIRAADKDMANMRYENVAGFYQGATDVLIFNPKTPKFAYDKARKIVDESNRKRTGSDACHKEIANMIRNGGLTPPKESYVNIYGDNYYTD